MSGYLLGDPFFGVAGIDPAVTPCFFCNEPLAGGMVVWHGAGDLLCLHQGCAEALAIHLIGDARTVQLQTDEIVSLHLSAPHRNPRRYWMIRLP